MGKIQPRDNPCYCINFRQAANTLTKFYDRILEPLHLTTNQFSLLNDIHLLGPCNKSQLAQYARLDRTTIIRNLNGLQEKNLVEGTSEAGAHAPLVQLTPLGREKIEEGIVLWKQAQRQVRDAIGQDNLALIKQVLKDITALE